MTERTGKYSIIARYSWGRRKCVIFIMHNFMKKNTLAIVVTYNRCSLLCENIQALLNQTILCDILVIDNNSTDNTKECVEKFKKDSQLEYINTGKNLGGAGGFSIGMEYALTNGYRYAWLMDDDTIPEIDALESLENIAAKLENKFSFLSSRVNWIDGSLCAMNLQILPENINEDFCHLKDGIVPIQRASFVSFFANCDIAKKVGLPIKEFFIYGDDWEYSLRMGAEDSAYFVNDSVVVHKMKSNVGAGVAVCEDSRIERCYYNVRNTYYIEKKYFSKKHLLKYRLYMWKDIVDVVLHSKSSKIKRCKVVLRGMRDGKRFNPKIEYIK